MTGTSSPFDDKPRVPLSKPVEAHGEMIREFVFREPTGGDIARCGNPVLFNPTTESINDIRFDEAKMSKMIAVLAAVPESTVAKLPAHDWMLAAWTVAGFFLMAPTAHSTSASS